MRRFVLTFIVLLSVFGLAAQQDAAIKFVASSNKDLKAKFSFTQNDVDPIVKKSETLKGSLTFDAPRKLVMIYSTPAGDKFVIDGDNLERVKGKKSNKVNLKKVKSMAGLANLLCNALMGKVNEIKKETGADMTYNAGKSTHDFIFKAPKKSKNYYKEVEVRYNKKSGRASYLRLVEKSGRYNEYNLTSI
ncbi:MAG: outer membrane lipoprotein carrier protein LolA [Paludibacteraceae bacterium]|nr:outer membrane lipoprotein carrier protein LolA [Paludibacteraceae bacterium]